MAVDWLWFTVELNTQQLQHVLAHSAHSVKLTRRNRDEEGVNNCITVGISSSSLSIAAMQ